jgi:hypothetical protein
LNNPKSAQWLRGGNILIADQSNNRVIEVNPNKQIVWTFTAKKTLKDVAFASYLEIGHILISDSGNNRIVEVDGSDNIVWQYKTNRQSGSDPSPSPSRAVRLKDGNTLISDQLNNRVILVETNTKRIIKQFGALNASGYDPSSANTFLYAPYDAKLRRRSFSRPFSW